MDEVEVQKMIKRRKLISDSGFRRFHSDLIREAEDCFSDHDRSLDKLIKMVEEGLKILRSEI